MADDYEKLHDWMARPDVRAAVARQKSEPAEPEADEEPPEQGRLWEEKDVQSL